MLAQQAVVLAYLDALCVEAKETCTLYSVEELFAQVSKECSVSRRTLFRMRDRDQNIAKLVTLLAPNVRGRLEQILEWMNNTPDQFAIRSVVEFCQLARVDTSYLYRSHTWALEQFRAFCAKYPKESPCAARIWKALKDIADDTAGWPTQVYMRTIEKRAGIYSSTSWKERRNCPKLARAFRRLCFFEESDVRICNALADFAGLNMYSVAREYKKKSWDPKNSTESPFAIFVKLLKQSSDKRILKGELCKIAGVSRAALWSRRRNPAIRSLVKHFSRHR